MFRYYEVTNIEKIAQKSEIVLLSSFEDFLGFFCMRERLLQAQKAIYRIFLSFLYTYLRTV